jgi:hypothetical protein
MSYFNFLDYKPQNVKDSRPEPSRHQLYDSKKQNFDEAYPVVVAAPSKSGPSKRPMADKTSDLAKRDVEQHSKATPTHFKDSKAFGELTSMILAGYGDAKRVKYLKSTVPSHIQNQKYYKDVMDVVNKLPARPKGAKLTKNEKVIKLDMKKNGNGNKKKKKNGNGNGKRQVAPVVSRNQSRYSAAPVSLGYQSFKIAGGPKMTRIVKRELIGKVSANSNAFSPATFFVNAAIPLSFPWLSRVAPSWEYYRFEKLCFSYVPTCSTATTGHVFMALDYDVADATPTSITQIDQLQTVSSGSVWSPQDMLASKAFMDMRNSGYYLTRPGAVPASSDQKNYDVGRFIIATIDTGSGATNCGLLYVDYDVIMYQQQANDDVPSSGRLNATTDATTPFAAGRSLATGSDPRIAYSPSAPTTTIVAQEAGQWLVEWDLVGMTALSAMAITAGPGAGSDERTIVAPAIFNTAATAGTLAVVYKIPSFDADAQPTLVFSFTGPASAGTSRVRFAPYTYDLL